MLLIKQPKNSALCGHCCLSMLLNKPVEYFIEQLGHSGPTNQYDMVKQLNGKVMNFVFGKVKEKHLNMILLQLHQNPKNSKQQHWTILNRGVILDPAEHKNLWPVNCYWIINLG